MSKIQVASGHDVACPGQRSVAGFDGPACACDPKRDPAVIYLDGLGIDSASAVTIGGIRYVRNDASIPDPPTIVMRGRTREY
jgi:hypothetical protein